jgi:hypothetical protein
MRRRASGVGLLVDRHEAHQPHEASDPFLVHDMVLIAQVPSYLMHTIKWRLQELLVTSHRNRVSTAGQRITRIRSRFISLSRFGS